MIKLIAILMLFCVRIFGQTTSINLPDKFQDLKINSTTRKTVDNLFGKPDTKTSCKRCGCMVFPYKTISYDYKHLGLSFFFERAKEDKTYRISSMTFAAPNSITFGSRSQIGVSNWEEVLEDFGTPHYKFDVPLSDMMVTYLSLDKKLVYRLDFDHVTQLLTSVSIFKNINSP